MKIELTQHVVDRYRLRICPEATTEEAEARIREGMKQAVRYKNRTKMGQLQYETPDCILIVKECSRMGLVAVTCIPKSYRESSWTQMMNELYQEFLDHEAGKLLPDPPVTQVADLQEVDAKKGSRIGGHQELLVSADTMIDQMRAHLKPVPTLRHEINCLNGQVESLKKRVEHHRDAEEKLFLTLKRVLKVVPRSLQVLQALGDYGHLLIKGETSE